MSFFSSNGSPICTEGRLAPDSSSKQAEARIEAPPMPSRPVAAPSRIARLPTPDAAESHELFPLQQAERHDVDQRVLGVPIGELDLAAEGRHADRVAVAGDAGDDTGEQVAVVGLVERPEAERVPDGHRPGPHGEDVAEDSADARSPLPGTARRRTDGCGSRSAAPPASRRRDRRRPAFSPGPNDDPRMAPSGSGPAMPGTTCRSNARTTSPSTWPARPAPASARGCRRRRRTRRRSSRAVDAAEGRGSRRYRLRGRPRRTRGAPGRRSEPRMSSTARSGCGISPATLPAALVIAAMRLAEPFGLLVASPRVVGHSAVRPARSASSASSSSRRRHVVALVGVERDPQHGTHWRRGGSGRCRSSPPGHGPVDR